MIRSIVFAAAVAAGTLASGSADASVMSYTYTASSGILNDVGGFNYYKWGINWAHSDEYITGAVLKLRDVYNGGSGDGALYTHLLNNPPSGETIYHDNQSGGDRFVPPGQGLGGGLARLTHDSYWIGTWNEPNGDPSQKTTLAYDLGDLGLLPTFRNFAANGRFGFGFDPDSDYLIEQVEVTIYTTVMPEPTTMALLGFGLLGLGFSTRRRHC